MLRLAPAGFRAAAGDARRLFPAPGPRRGRVALLSGCVANALAPEINEAAIRVLTRHGFDVVWRPAKAVVVRWLTTWATKTRRMRRRGAIFDAGSIEIDGEGIDAILTTASGCGTTMKDYGFMLRHQPGYRRRRPQGSPG